MDDVTDFCEDSCVVGDSSWTNDGICDDPNSTLYDETYADDGECSFKTDCSDCTDEDGDGVSLTLDCDDNNADLGASADDADCDGLCDNGSGTLLLEDMDCDGILNADDTDADGDLICDETGTLAYIDTDCDGVDDVTDFCEDSCVVGDSSWTNDGICDDPNSTLYDDTYADDGTCMLGTDCSDCTDADGDGVNLTLDCDDNNADLRESANDEDCDGLCDNGSGTLLLEDMDCDGILNSDDADADGDLICDETGTLAYIDTDCDGVDDVTDFCEDSCVIGDSSWANDGICDDPNSTLYDDTYASTGTCMFGTDCADCTDADGDGVNLTLDCDDNDVSLGSVNDDEDCDGLCDNGSGTPLLEDTDCDGILNADDADADGDLICDETGTFTYIDTDCDGVDDVTDFCEDSCVVGDSSWTNDGICDDPNSTIYDDSFADDGVCSSGTDCSDCTDEDGDGVSLTLDCDDSDANITTTKEEDSDCNGILDVDELCEDSCEINGSSWTNDGICDDPNSTIYDDTYVDDGV